MYNTCSRVFKNPSRLLVAGIAVTTAFTFTRPDLLTKVYANENLYDWVKQVDINNIGGEYMSAASSSDGSHLILTGTEGGESTTASNPLWISRDRGTNWENVSAEIDTGYKNVWTSVDISNDGQRMVASSSEHFDQTGEGSGDGYGRIAYSEDAGDTWDIINEADDSWGAWERVVISGDGDTIVATDWSGSPSISEDGGTTWSSSYVDSLYSLDSISISDNGDVILIGGENSTSPHGVFVSTDKGANWEFLSPQSLYDNDSELVHVAMSATGDKLIAASQNESVENPDSVHISHDYGNSWIDITPEDEVKSKWSAAGVSDDGEVISVLDENDIMYVTENDGEDWKIESPGAEYDDVNKWAAVDFNSNGKLGIVAGAEFVYLNPSYEETETPTKPRVELDNAEDGEKIILSTPDGTTISCYSAIKEANVSAQDGEYTYPVGLVDFCFSGAGENNEVSLIFVTDLKPDQIQVRKFNPNNSEYGGVADTSVTQTTYEGAPALTVTYNIVDNGPLDTNPTIGEIADPVGIAVLAATAPNTGHKPGQSFTQAATITALAVVTLTAASVKPLRRRIAIRNSASK